MTRIRRLAAAPAGRRAGLPTLIAMSTSSRPLSEGNRFQRRYHAWAARHYARMPEDVREQAELIDRFLYSRRGLGFWFGLIAAAVGTGVGLTAAGMPALLAVAISLIFWVALPLGVLGAWMQPRKILTGGLARKAVIGSGLGLAGGLCGFLVGHVARNDGFEAARFATSLLDGLKYLVPAALGASIAMLAATYGVAHVRQQLMERELARTRLARERDAAARQAAEARLKLLQAQIQPHFIFNTLAALQHWVDTGDARAPGLLRTLAAFLRGSTELLGREVVPLGDEWAAASQYLTIMQARLGDRLRFDADLGPGCDVVLLPPGLLLTLVENAIEHGIAPALDGGTVCIVARLGGDGVLSVRVHDDGVGLATGWVDGTGLANSRERLRHHGNGRGTLTLRQADPGTEATLTLPGAAR